MNTLYTILEHYYNMESTSSLIWKMYFFLEGKAADYRRKLQAAPSDMDFVRYVFYSRLDRLFVCIFLASPQLIVWPCYLLARLIYRNILYDFSSIENQNSIEEIKEWCIENKVKAFWFYKWHLHDIIICGTETFKTTDAIGFLNKEDLIAFKLRWS